MSYYRFQFIFPAGICSYLIWAEGIGQSKLSIHTPSSSRLGRGSHRKEGGSEGEESETKSASGGQERPQSSSKPIYKFQNKGPRNQSQSPHLPLTDSHMGRHWRIVLSISQGIISHPFPLAGPDRPARSQDLLHWGSVQVQVPVFKWNKI